MPCLTVLSECIDFQENNQNINILGFPPNTFAIGYAHNDNLPLGDSASQYGRYSQRVTNFSQWLSLEFLVTPFMEHHFVPYSLHFLNSVTTD